MIYEAAIENDKLVMTPPAGETFKKYARREITLGDAAAKVGMVTEETLGSPDGEPNHLAVTMSSEDKKDFQLLYTLKFDALKAALPGLVEIEGMSATIPWDVMYNDGKLDHAGSKAFLSKVFSDVAAGRESEHGYKVRALVNPASVETVEDHGGYREICFRDEYGPYTLHTALPPADLKARLKP